MAANDGERFNRLRRRVRMAVRQPLQRSPTRQCWFESLEPAERLRSVQLATKRAFKEGASWRPDDLVRDKWEKEIYEQIRIIMIANHSHLYKQLSVRPSCLIDLWMIGRSEETAWPTVVASCPSNRVACKAIGLIKKHKILGTSGFDLLAHTTVIEQSGDNPHSLTLEPSSSLCGASIVITDPAVSLTKAGGDRRATLGGTIRIDSDLFAITVAHPFWRSFGNDAAETLSIYSGSESEAESRASSRSIAQESVVSTEEHYGVRNIFLDRYNAERPTQGMSSQSMMLAEQWEVVPSKYLALDEDWAILKVDSGRFGDLNEFERPPNTIGEKETLFSLKIASGAPNGKICSATGSSGVIQGHSQGMRSCLVVGKNGSAHDLWSASLSTSLGDCGSWVVNHGTGEIYGAIVAGVEALEMAYILPAEVISEALQSKWPFSRMEFPSLPEQSLERMMDWQNVTALLSDRARWPEAEKLLDRIITISLKVHESDEPKTIIATHFMALLHMKVQQWQQAEEMFTRVVEFRKVYFGRNDSRTAVTMVNLAATLHRQMHYSKAEAINRTALHTLQQKLGSTNPATLTCMHNLVLALLAQNKEAMDLGLQVWKGREQVLGARHPDTLASMENMIAIYSNDDLLEQAQDMAINVLTLRKSVLGVTHPDTLRCMGILARIWKDTGQEAEAIQLLQETVSLFVKELDADHPDRIYGTQLLRYWMAATTEQQRTTRPSKRDYQGKQKESQLHTLYTLEEET